MTNAIIPISVPFDGGSIDSRSPRILMRGENSFVYAYAQENPGIYYAGFIEFDDIASSSPNIVGESVIANEGSDIYALEEELFFELSTDRYGYFVLGNAGEYDFFVFDLSGNTLYPVFFTKGQRIPSSQGTRQWYRTFVIPIDANSFYWFYHLSDSDVRIDRVSFSETNGTISRTSAAVFSLPASSTSRMISYDVDENGKVYVYGFDSSSMVTEVKIFDPVTETVSNLPMPSGTYSAFYVMRSDRIFAIPAGTTFQTSYAFYDGFSWSVKSISHTASVNYWNSFRLDDDVFALETLADVNEFNPYIKIFKYDGSDLLVSDAVRNSDGLQFPESVPPGYTYMSVRLGKGNKSFVKRNADSFVYVITRYSNTDISFMVKTIKGTT